MRRALALVCVLACAALGHANQVATSGEGASKKASFTDITITLEHSLGLAQQFSSAGHFSARANVKAETGAVRLSHIRLTRRAFEDADTATFKKLVADNDVYRVRVPADVLNPESGGHVMTWLPARCLVESGLQESFVLHMDEAGHVVSLEYGQPGGGCRIRSDMVPDCPDRLAFRTSVSAKFAKEAPRLPVGPVRVTPDFEDDPFAGEQDAAQGKGEGDEAPKSIFQKYWFVLVPLILTNILGAAAGPDQPAAKPGQKAVAGGSAAGGSGAKK